MSCSKPAMHLSTADDSTHLQPESNNSQGLVGVLGGLCIILTTLLVGVVMGWVCSRSRTPQPQERWVKTHNKVSQFLLHCFSSHRDHTGHPPTLTNNPVLPNSNQYTSLWPRRAPYEVSLSTTSTPAQPETSEAMETDYHTDYRTLQRQ